MEKSIIFLHLPKTAGQSVHRYLTKVFGTENICPVRVNNQFREYSHKQIIKYKIFSGHLDWKSLEFVNKPVFTFTILRDPLERIVSFYLYMKNKAMRLDEEEIRLSENTGLFLASNSIPDEYFSSSKYDIRRFIDNHYDNFYSYYFATMSYTGRLKLLQKLSEEFNSQNEINCEIVNIARRNIFKLDKIYSINNWQEKLSEDLYEFTGNETALKYKKIRIYANKGEKSSITNRLEKIKSLGGTQKTFDKLYKFTELDYKLLSSLEGIDIATLKSKQIVKELSKCCS